jgi:hypothetical protein
LGFGAGLGLGVGFGACPPEPWPAEPPPVDAEADDELDPEDAAGRATTETEVPADGAKIEDEVDPKPLLAPALPDATDFGSAGGAGSGAACTEVFGGPSGSASPCAISLPFVTSTRGKNSAVRMAPKASTAAATLITVRLMDGPPPADTEYYEFAIGIRRQGLSR